MPFCPSCGNRVSEDADYCSRCGTYLREETMPRNVSDEEENRRDAGRAILFGLLSPGGASFYAGDVRKGIAYYLVPLIALVPIIVILIFPSFFFSPASILNGTPILLVILILCIVEAVWIYSVYDGYKSTKKK